MAIKLFSKSLFGMKFWNGEDVIIKEGVYLHGVCELKELYVEGRRSIKEAIYLNSMIKIQFN